MPTTDPDAVAALEHMRAAEQHLRRILESGAYDSEEITLAINVLGLAIQSAELAMTAPPPG